ncbi:hypothetical protein QFC20_006823 [Naganishia adeliensis]|uniref:Uncharacterized protein n=1 Tax=Naganishia adeliensis TaxID=92952 RepID=A0ACC2V637_9TREE|nr:hypothetical protein QFC20_006823 [Naganishia adeliensis]
MSLSSILGNTQTPHQSLLVIADTPTLPGHAVLKDLVRRNLESNTPAAFVCVLHPPVSYGLTTQNARILDLTDLAYDAASPFERLETWLRTTVDELGRGVQVYIDALDVLVEDWDAAGRAVRLVKSLLKDLRGLKAPSRLVLLVPKYSPFLDHLITPSLSPTITLLQLHAPLLIAHLASTFLTSPPASGILDSASESAGMKFWSILNASDGLGSAGWAGAAAGDVRGKGKAKAEGTSFALSGEELGSGGVIELVDWASSGEGEVESAKGGVVVQVLVRKLQGGANKGMSRSLEALVPRGAGLVACPWNEVDGLRDVGRTYVSSAVEPEKESQENHPSQQHIPFNLSLTASQQASRAQVPIPYAHEGDDAPSTVPQGGIIFEPGSEDDMDDDDPDEDLDF